MSYAVPDNTAPLLNYQIHGSGPCLLFLHGYCDSLEVWATVTNYFSATHTVIAVDLPGHGHSAVTDPNMRFDEVAHILTAILAHHQIKHCVPVGHSMGGYVALAFAELYPEMVNKLVLVHAHPFADTLSKRTKRYREITLIETGHLNLILKMQAVPRFLKPDIYSKKLAETALPVSVDGALWALRAMMERRDSSQWLCQSSVPFLCCVSGHDDAMPVESTLRCAEIAPMGRAALFEQSRHMCFWEEETTFTKVLTQFL